MLRITENLEPGKTVRLRLDGNISTESLPELEEMLARYPVTEGKTIILDLAGVDFMNDQAARKIAGRQSDRLRVINCSPYITALLQCVGTAEQCP